MGMLSLRQRGGLRPWSMPFDIEKEFNRMLGDPSFGFGNGEERFSPAIDVRETDDAFLVEADVPGLSKDEVQIEVVDNVLSIKGERKSTHEEKRKDYHRVERQFGSFRRSVSIPGGFKHDAVEAKFENGVLKVTLPKLEEAKPRRIEVKTT